MARLETFSVWIPEEDICDVHENVLNHGKLADEWAEDPKETGDPYRLVRRYEYGDMDVEIFYLDRKGKRIGDIRASIPTHIIYGDDVIPLASEKELDSEGNPLEAFSPRSLYIQRRYLELLDPDSITDCRLTCGHRL